MTQFTWKQEITNQQRDEVHGCIEADIPTDDEVLGRVDVDVIDKLEALEEEKEEEEEEKEVVVDDVPEELVAEEGRDEEDEEEELCDVELEDGVLLTEVDVGGALLDVGTVLELSV